MNNLTTDTTHANAVHTPKGEVVFEPVKHTVWIHDEKIDEFKSALAKLDRKLQKKGFPAIIVNDMHKTEVRSAKDPKGHMAYNLQTKAWEPALIYWLVNGFEIYTHSVKCVGDWTVLGDIKTVATSDDGKPMNICTTYPGMESKVEELDAFRDHDMRCDHCGHNRNRKHCFVLWSATHGVVQVGSTCMKDFLGTDPTYITSALTKPDDLVTSYSTGPINEESIYASLDNVLPWLCRHLRVNAGKYLSAARAKLLNLRHLGGGYIPTHLSIRRDMNAVPYGDYVPPVPNDDDIAMAQDIAADMRANSDRVCAETHAADSYEFKLAALVRQGGAQWRYMGILIGGAYRAWQDKNQPAEPVQAATPTVQAAAPTVQREFLGARGATITTRVRFHERYTTAQGRYGTVYVIKGTEVASGAQWVWFCSSQKFINNCIRDGKVYVSPTNEADITAKVKSTNSHHRFGKTTTLTRLTRA